MGNPGNFLTQIKIPTLLGLALLIVGLGGGVLLVNQTQVFKSHAASSESPAKITINNITGSSASISWQTDKLTTGFIKAGLNSSLNQTLRDDRDTTTPTEHKIHFVTLPNLVPNTTYYFKIDSGTSLYPTGNALKFTTSNTLPPTNTTPLIGKVVDSNNQPVSEALLILEIPGAQELSTITKIAGYYILPLANLKNNTLSQAFSFPNGGVNVKLNVTDGNQTSVVSIHLPNTQTPLPPIILGQNLNLITPAPTASPSATLKDQSPLSKYDLNGDGKVNSLDSLIVIHNFGKNPKEKRADLNGDGVVDQKDLNLINGYIANSPVQ